jgi:hypothetical protein
MGATEVLGTAIKDGFEQVALAIAEHAENMPRPESEGKTLDGRLFQR